MKTSKKIAFSSILAALSVIIMLIGSFFGSLDLTAAALASFCIILAVIEMGYRNALLIYLVASVLSLLLLPSKSTAVFFAVFLGYYPIVKSLAERFNKAISYLIKYASYFLSYAVLAVIVIKFFPEAEIRKYLLIGAFIGAAVLFIYDFALSKIVVFYCSSLRSRLGINKFFDNKNR